MTETTVDERRAPAIPDDLHEEACELIRALGTAGGDADAAYAELSAYCSRLSKDAALAGIAAALIVTFTECITHPVEPGEFTDLVFPQDPTEGATTDV